MKEVVYSELGLKKKQEEEKGEDYEHRPKLFLAKLYSLRRVLEVFTRIGLDYEKST